MIYIAAVYEIEQTGAFSDCLRDLKDSRAKARIRARIERASLGNFGDWSPEGGEVRAMCIDYGLNVLHHRRTLCSSIRGWNGRR